jgi:hypothetical protein
MSKINTPANSLVALAETPTHPLDYILLYAYPIAFLGAIFFSIHSFMDIQPLSIFANNHVTILLFMFISLSGFVSLIYWFEDTNISLVTTIIKSTSNIYNINTLKETSNS